MRCDQVIQELSAPQNPTQPSGLADHLASCPRCAEWSRLARQFDRVWEATRPAAPSAETLDAIWARASLAMDAAPGQDVIRFASPNRRKWLKLGLITAQAAAVLVAASLLLSHYLAPSGVVLTILPGPKTIAPPLNVGVDQTVIVRIGDDGHQVDVLDDSSQFAFSMADSTPHDVFSAVESMVVK